jgi:L-alanine-DL-glutamate epimerase-like enolase superfamily enzyme
MKNTMIRLSFRPYPLQLRYAFGVATSTRTSTPGVKLTLEWEGIVGYGEASMPPYLGHTVESVCKFFERVDLSGFNDPTQMDEILTYVDSLSQGDAPAKAAIDIALHDLVGKIIGKPVYAMYGLDPSLAPSTTYTIGIDTEDMVRTKTREYADLFNILKVKVGVSKESDMAMINTIRSVTNKPLVVDANQGWTCREEALDRILWLKEQDVRMIEQPMPKDRHDDIAWLTQHSPIPIMADESVQRLCDVAALKGVFSGINIKLMKSTGIREAWRMMQLARELDMKVMLGCMTETSCAVTAAAHLSPAVDFADLDGNLLIANDIYEGVKVVEGRLTLPDRPGLGLICK